MSWFFNQEGTTDIKNTSYTLQTTTYSKANTVVKEFESYMWADRWGSDWKTSHATEFYDYTSVNAGNSDTYGFISVLSSVNDVAYGDGIWVAVGNQSGKNPMDYCASGSVYSSNYYIDDGIGTGTRPGAGKAASYVNVKFTNSAGISQWKAVRISDATNVNIISVVYCQSVWYIMGYVDSNGNGQNDANEDAVLYYSVDPAEDGKWYRCMTCAVNSAGQYVYDYSNGTTAVRFDTSSKEVTSMKLEGINKMASQG